MQRSPGSQIRHDDHIRKLAGKYEKDGFTVCADVPGYTRPGKLDGIRPDILALRGDRVVIVEVETQDSDGSPRDMMQQEVFEKAARKDGCFSFLREVASDG